jgi:hypothetical protein
VSPVRRTRARSCARGVGAWPQQDFPNDPHWHPDYWEETGAPYLIGSPVAVAWPDPQRIVVAYCLGGGDSLVPGSMGMTRWVGDHGKRFGRSILPLRRSRPTRRSAPGGMPASTDSSSGVNREGASISSGMGGTKTLEPTTRGSGRSSPFSRTIGSSRYLVCVYQGRLPHRVNS